MYPVKDSDKVFIDKITQILEENLENEHFGVSDLAAAAGVSRSQLHRKVHAHNGNSTSQFIREYRLSKAIEMLKKNEATVAEIAYGVGFSSPTYFNSCFKEYYGYPPGEAKLRAVSSDRGGDNSQDPNPLIRTKDKIKLLHRKLSLTKKWIVVLSIGIGVMVTWATFYYLGTKADTEVTNFVNLNKGNSIAVLPFKNWSGDPDLEYIGAGLTDAIITRLSLVQTLNVTPFTSVLKYKSTDQDAPSIAKELGVQNILQGNFQLSGEQVKITLHLIHGPSNTNVSSNVYSSEWRIDEIFSMQAAVVEELVRQLKIDIDSEELLAVERIPTQNEEAYNIWLKAKYSDIKSTQEGMQNAIPLYEEAIRLDSTFLDPYVDLAKLYIRGGGSWGLFSEEEAWNKTKNLLLKARQIDSTYMDATKALNKGLYLYEWDFNNMEKNYSKNVTFSMKYQYCLQTGRYEEALAIIEKMIVESCVQENMNVEWCTLMNTSKVGALILLNRTEEALEILKSNEKLLLENFMFLRIASEIYFYMGEFERSYALLSKIKERYPDNNPPTILWTIAACEYRKGNIEKAKEYVADLENRYQMGTSGSPAWFTAQYYASIGDHEKAFTWLQNAYERHELEMIWLRTAPPLKPLRSDPRYLELYYKVGFPMPPHTD